MPVYCYRDMDTGELVERQFDLGHAPAIIEEEGKEYVRDLAAEIATHGGRARRTWPMYSDAAGVHPLQVPEAEAHARALGIPTHFTPDGRAEFLSPQHRKAYCEAVGLFDRNGGYGDPQRRRR